MLNPQGESVARSRPIPGEKRSAKKADLVEHPQQIFGHVGLLVDGHRRAEVSFIQAFLKS
jgi:hypothetical protein